MEYNKESRNTKELFQMVKEVKPFPSQGEFFCVNRHKPVYMSFPLSEQVQHCLIVRAVPYKKRSLVGLELQKSKVAFQKSVDATD